MPYRTDVAYIYDGSFEGLMCCVFESIYKKEMPIFIRAEEEAEYTLFETRMIETDVGKAERVTASVAGKISPRALKFIKLAFLTCLENREIHILKFLHMGYKNGKNVMNMLAHDTVNTLVKAVSALKVERHRYCQFVRFSDYGGVLAAEIEPKNQVLPLIAMHFADRLQAESFMIHDKTHKAILLYSKGKTGIYPVENIELPKPGKAEREYRRMWRAFYNAIAVEGRENPRCRMNMMPKRYWNMMTEFLKEDEVLEERGELENKKMPGLFKTGQGD